MLPLEVSFREELNSVQSRLRKEINLKAADFKELVNLAMDDLDRDACPAIVLAVSRACGYAGEKAIGLALIVEFVYMADQVHRLMYDDDNIPEAERQFPVLVGDFLYGKFFLGLCREQLLVYLAPLAKVICTMSEGAIGRWLASRHEPDSGDWLGILAKERAALTGVAARLGAELAGASRYLQDKCEDLGWNLGLAWAAGQHQSGKSIVLMALDKAAQIISELPDTLQLRPLQELYNFMADRCSPETEIPHQVRA